MMDFLRNKMAFSTTEYVILITVCVLAIIGMQAYFKRGVEGGLRRQIDQMAGQFSSDYENTTMAVTEYTKQTESQYRGIINVTVSQNTTRLSNETIEPQGSEWRIGI